MPQVTVIPERDDIPREGLLRSLAGLTAAITLSFLNRCISPASVNEGTDPAKATTQNEFLYAITGVINRFDAAGADIFDLAGLTPVLPGNYQQYVFLVDHLGNGRVQEAVQSPYPNLVAFTNLSNNAYEATCIMLNTAPDGWCAVGGLAIQVDPASPSPFQPGIDTLATNPMFLIRDFYDGFDGTILLPSVSPAPNVLGAF